MAKPFAVAVALIVLLTVGAILIVRRVTEPLPPQPAVAGSTAATAEAPPAASPPPVLAEPPANRPPAGGALLGSDSNGVPQNQSQLVFRPQVQIQPQPAQPPEPEEGDQRRPPARRLNSGSHSNRPNQPNQSDE